MALGARSIDMKRLLIFEAVLLSVVCSTVGIICASLIGLLANLAMNISAHQRGVRESFNRPLSKPQLKVIYP